MKTVKKTFPMEYERCGDYYYIVIKDGTNEANVYTGIEKADLAKDALAYCKRLVKGMSFASIAEQRELIYKQF